MKILLGPVVQDLNYIEMAKKGLEQIVLEIPAMP